MVRDHADPLHEVGSQLERLMLPAEDHADFLKNFFGRRGITQQRDKIREQPAVMLGKEPGERVAPLIVVGRISNGI